MGKPQAPTPPDPQQTSAAQTGTNVSTSIANTMMGNVNQTTPYGSLEYTQVGDYEWTDPYTGQSYTVPQFEAVTSLNPEQQAIADLNTQTQTALAGTGAQQSEFLQGYLADGIDPNALPAGGVLPDAPNLGSINVGPQLDQELGNAGPITTTYGTDFSQDRQRVEDALMSRINPRLEQDRAALDARLANQGIVPGSEAYNREIDRFNQGATDARMQAILAGGQEQSRLADLEAQRAGFQNAAQAQAFGQGLTGASFANQAAQQMFGNMMDAQAFNNQTAQQGFANQMGQYDAQNAARATALNEMFALRNQPINEIVALLNGSQVQSPQFNINQPASMPYVDNAALINQNYQQRYNNYLNQYNNASSLAGGLMGAVAAFSDIRLKRDVRKVGEVEGLNIYDFRYEWSDDPQRGFMAQEVAAIRPDAVIQVGPWLALDYNKLPEAMQ